MSRLSDVGRQGSGIFVVCLGLAGCHPISSRTVATQRSPSHNPRVSELLDTLSNLPSEPSDPVSNKRLMDQSAKELMDLGNAAVPDLIAVIDSKTSVQKHRMAITFLAKTNDSRTVETLRKLLRTDSSNPLQRPIFSDANTVAGSLVANTKPELFQDLLEAAEAKRIQPYYAARVFGSYKRTAAIPYLKKLVTSGSDIDVATATEALGSIGGPEVLPEISKLCGDSRPIVAISAWVARAAVDPDIKKDVAIANVSLYVGHSGSLVRLEALKALVALGDPKAKDRLLAALADKDSMVRTMAIEMLADFPSPEVRARLAPFARDPDPYIRASAKETLGNMKG